MFCDYCKNKGNINACLSCKFDESLQDNFEPKEKIGEEASDVNLHIRISAAAYKAALENDELHTDRNYLMNCVREGKVLEGSGGE